MPGTTDFRIDTLIAERLRAYRSGRRAQTRDADAPPLLFGLDLPARVDCMSSVAAFVAEAARRRGLTDDATSVVELAIFEACVNVIEHAYRFDATRRFRVDLLEEEDRLTFQIENGGEPLDPQRLRRVASSGEPVVHRDGRGLGLPIILRAMDDVFCEREPDGTNRLVLIKRVHETAAAD